MTSNEAQGVGNHTGIQPSATGRNAATSRPKLRAKTSRQAQEPPAPWQTHREDFVAVPRNAETDALEEQFERQAKLLGELVTPVEYDATFVRSAPMPNGEDLMGSGAYAQHMQKVYLNYIDPNIRGYRRPDRICKPLYDVVCFHVANDKAAFLNNVCDLADIPFQGSGGFGLAVVPTSLKRADVDEVFTKIALCQFLEAAPQDLECIVVTRASKLDLRRLGEIEDAGIPIVFDFSGRTGSTKGKRDPLENMFSKSTRGPHVFNGRLSDSQIALLGDSLSDETTSSMLQTLWEAALDETTSYHQAQWTGEIIDTLTFGHEVVKHNSGTAGAPTAPLHYYAQSMRSRYVKPSTPWQFAFATFPPESMPTTDSAKTIKRMHDVGAIWHKTLKECGLALYTERTRGLRRNRYEEPYTPDNDALQEIGRFLGIDAMIESLYDGVPLDYIL